MFLPNMNINCGHEYAKRGPECNVVLKRNHLGNGQGRTPLFLQNIKTNAPVAVNIWMENLGSECHLYERGEKIQDINVSLPITR